jgi:hypothetical protein
VKSLEILAQEMGLSWSRWGEGLRESLVVRDWIRDFLPGLLPPFLPPIVQRAWDSVTALPELLFGGLGATAARVVLPGLLEDKKLHSQVIPLDRVVSTIGPAFVRDMLSFGRARTPRQTKRPFDDIRKVIEGKFSLEGKFKSILEARIAAGAAK